MKYILASQSPRRKELMKEISSSFEVCPSTFDEVVSHDLSIKEQVAKIALEKGKEVHHKYPHDLVISADTIVVLDNQVIGKPKDKEDAKRILRLLSGKTHEVLTAFSLFKDEQIVSDIVQSFVTFNLMSKALINEYVESKSPLDKAGAYGVQDNEKYHFIAGVKGSIKNVIGFPVEEIKEAIKKIEA